MHLGLSQQNYIHLRMRISSSAARCIYARTVQHCKQKLTQKLSSIGITTMLVITNGNDHTDHLFQPWSDK